MNITHDHESQQSVFIYFLLFLPFAATLLFQSEWLYSLVQRIVSPFDILFSKLSSLQNVNTEPNCKWIWKVFSYKNQLEFYMITKRFWQMNTLNWSAQYECLDPCTVESVYWFSLNLRDCNKLQKITQPSIRLDLK